MDRIEDVLAHFGVKGMRWGVRKAPGAPPGPASQVQVTVKGGRIVKTAGGKNVKPTDDAISAAAALQKAKASSTAALSNKELADLNKRLQLEQQYTKLVPTGKVKKGQHFTKEVLDVGSTVNDVMTFAKSPAGKAIAAAFVVKGGKHVKR